MRINVLLFAAARDAVDSDEVEVEVADNATAADVLAAVGELSPAMQALVPYCRLAIDSRYADASASVVGAKELALIPPVSGG